MLRRFGAATIVIIVVSVVTVVALLIFRPKLDVTAFKTAIEVPLTTFMETPVTVERVLLKPGSWVLIELQGIRVEAAGREAGTELASADPPDSGC